MNKTTTLTGIYGLTTIIGGLIGYFIAGSTISLWAGNIAGVAIIAAALGILSQYRWGFQLGCACSLALTIFFAFRFIGSRAWFPSGIMAFFSIIVFVVLFWQLQRNFRDEVEKDQSPNEIPDDEHLS